MNINQQRKRSLHWRKMKVLFNAIWSDLWGVPNYNAMLNKIDSAYRCHLTLGSTLCLQGFMLVFITTILYCKSFRLVHESTALVIPRITAWDPPFPCSRLGDFSSDHECRPYAWRCDHIYKHGTRPKIELRNSIAFRKLHSWSEERWNREERWITAVHCVNLKSPELKLE